MSNSFPAAFEAGYASLTVLFFAGPSLYVGQSLSDWHEIRVAERLAHVDVRAASTPLFCFSRKEHVP